MNINKFISALLAGAIFALASCSSIKNFVIGAPDYAPKTTTESEPVKKVRATEDRVSKRTSKALPGSLDTSHLPEKAKSRSVSTSKPKNKLRTVEEEFLPNNSRKVVEAETAVKSPPPAVKKTPEKSKLRLPDMMRLPQDEDVNSSSGSSAKKETGESVIVKPPKSSSGSE